MCACLCECMPHECRCLKRPEEIIGHLRDGIVGGCEQPNMGAWSKLGSPGKAANALDQLNNLSNSLTSLYVYLSYRLRIMLPCKVWDGTR